MYFSASIKTLSAALFVVGLARADGLYSKSSAVLQIDGKSYDKLIAKSNLVSVSYPLKMIQAKLTTYIDCRVCDTPTTTVKNSTDPTGRFYAPWCGHCQSLKPAYEKAAKGLKDLAQVAAVNCDDEINKAFCGSMDVKGFPTLKVVKPGKKPGKPSVEDYAGPRTAGGIIDAVKSAIPNHVKRISDKGLEGWFKAENETAKAVLFSEKGTTSALIKVLASEYLGSMTFAQIRDKEADAVEMFGVEEYPTLFVLPGGAQDAVKFDGTFTKESMKEFLSKYAKPTAKSSSEKQKPLGKKAEKKENSKEKSSSDSSTFSEASTSASQASASSSAISATSITLEEENSPPTESPNPDPAPSDAPKPIKLAEVHPPIEALIEERYLDLQCLGPKTTTCILALLPKSTDDEASLPDPATSALASLAEIADKHKKRGSKLFPFYSIPARNTGAAKLRDTLTLKDDSNIELVAINGRRGWYRHYASEDFSIHAVETWVDVIRLGEGQKSKLPEGLVVEQPEPVVIKGKMGKGGQPMFEMPEGLVLEEVEELDDDGDGDGGMGRGKETGTEEEMPMPVEHGEL